MFIPYEHSIFYNKKVRVLTFDDMWTSSGQDDPLIGWPQSELYLIEIIELTIYKFLPPRGFDPLSLGTCEDAMIKPKSLFHRS